MRVVHGISPLSSDCDSRGCVLVRVGVVGLLRCVCVGGVSFWVPLRLIHRYLYLFF